MFWGHVRQEEAISFKKTNLRVVILEPVFFRLGAFGQGSVEQIESAVHVFDDRFEATRADHFNFCFELAFDANLTFEKLGRGGDFDMGDLLDLRRMVIDAARGVALPDAQLANSEIFYVEEQVLNASRANAHAVSLFRRAGSKSRNRAAFWYFCCTVGKGWL